MIIVETDRIYCIYTRTNRHIRWKYAQYGGRYESPEKCIEEAKKHCASGTEYLIETMDGERVAVGFIGQGEQHNDLI